MKKIYECDVFIKGVGNDSYWVTASNISEAIEECHRRIEEETDFDTNRVDVVCVTLVRQ